MDKEIVNYIINLYSRFFTENELKAHRHLNSLIKLDGESENSSRYIIYKRKGWINSDFEVLELIKNGENKFYLDTANRILLEHKNEIFFNNCPICNKQARTPKAKQCTFCGHKWFE